MCGCRQGLLAMYKSTRKSIFTKLLYIADYSYEKNTIGKV